MLGSTEIMAMLGAYRSHQETTMHDRYRYPPQIDDLSDLRKIEFENKIRDLNGADKIYYHARAIISSFETTIPIVINQLKEVLTSTDINKLNSEVNKFKQEYKTANKNLIKINSSLIQKNVEPDVYFSIRKHILLAQVFIRLMDESKIDIAETKRIVLEYMDKDNNLDAFELGYFVALEPILVIGALNAIKFRDKNYITTYKALIDKFMRLVAHKYRSLYLEVSGLSNKKFNQAEFSNFVTELEASRNA